MSAPTEPTISQLAQAISLINTRLTAIEKSIRRIDTEHVTIREEVDESISRIEKLERQMMKLIEITQATTGCDQITGSPSPESETE